MTHRITTFVTAFALGALLLFAAVFSSASSAKALTSSGFATGYLSSTGWWLGSYALDDGSRGFCLEAGRPSPVGHTSDYVDGADLDWFTPDQSAKLAYISRTWAATGDRVTAAAGQLATWMITGLNGRTLESYAARAGGDASAVLARSHAMLDEAGREASRGVTASATIEISDSGAGRLRIELSVDRLTGASLALPDRHSGTVELSGAQFADGATSAVLGNGLDLPVQPVGTDPTVSIAVSASFASLPYGDRLRVAVARDNAQSLLIALPASAEASAAANGTGVSPLPFQPRVSTVTSASTAFPGDAITDHLTVDVAHRDGLLPTWAVRPHDDALVPVEAIIESRLLGPFPDGIQPATVSPADAPVVCSVEVAVTGPGEYETPSCTLPAPGEYVWVETIDPARTPADLGGSRMLPWSSAFGVASEITRVSAPATDSPPTALTATATPTTARLAETGSAPAGGILAAATALGAGTILIGVSARRRRQPAHSATTRPRA